MEKHRFSFTAGALVRRDICRALREGAMKFNVEINFDENRGWLDSQYVCTVSGSQENVGNFLKAAAKFADRLKSEE